MYCGIRIVENETMGKKWLHFNSTRAEYCYFSDNHNNYCNSTKNPHAKSLEQAMAWIGAVFGIVKFISNSSKELQYNQSIGSF